MPVYNPTLAASLQALAARAISQGIIKYFAQKDGVAAVYVALAVAVAADAMSRLAPSENGNVAPLIGKPGRPQPISDEVLKPAPVST